MLKHQFKYEWLQLLRERWVVALLIIFIGVTTYAVYNGKQKMDSRTRAIAKAKADMQTLDKEYARQIDSISRGLLPAPDRWLDPRSLSVYGQRAPRVVSMDAQPLAFISVGQSDLFAHYVKPKLYGEAYALGFSELTNPVQLLFGSFDFAFVFVYLLPLLIIAFSYNLLSQDKESGSLRLTLAQPISLYGWLFSRTVLRFFVIAAILVTSTTLALVLNGVASVVGSVGFRKVLIVIITYAFFWFLLALLVNLFGKSSGQNAVALVSLWVVLVLLLPSVISQTANTIYPVPSRINMIHEYRVAEAQADKDADKILKSYYRDHPELAPTDSTEKNQYSFWLEYFASVDMMKQSVSHVLDSYNRAIENQQAWVDKLRVLSPAILLQDALNDQAGTAPAHYRNFREQVIRFAEDWKGYFLPRMFRNENMRPEDLSDLPAFAYNAKQVEPVWLFDWTLMLGWCGGMTAFGMLLFRVVRLERIVSI